LTPKRAAACGDGNKSSRIACGHKAIIPNAALLQGRPGYTRLMALERQLRCQGFTGGMVMMSINAFLPLYVQGAMGRSPAAAGLALGAASVSWTFASLAAGRLMIRTSYRLAATVGGAFLIAGTLVLRRSDFAGRCTLGPRRKQAVSRRTVFRIPLADLC
jgi:hypothetical protein